MTTSRIIGAGTGVSSARGIGTAVSSIVATSPLVPPVTRGRTAHFGALGQSYELGALRGWESSAPESTDFSRFIASWVLTQRPTLTTVNGYPCPMFARASSAYCATSNINTTEITGTASNLFTSTARTLMISGTVPSAIADGAIHGLDGGAGLAFYSWFTRSGSSYFLSIQQDGQMNVAVPGTILGRKYVYIERHGTGTLDVLLWVDGNGTYTNSASRGAVSNSLNYQFQFGAQLDGVNGLDAPLVSITPHNVALTDNERTADLTWAQNILTGPSNPYTIATHPATIDPLDIGTDCTLYLGEASWQGTPGAALSSVVNLAPAATSLTAVGSPLIDVSINGLRSMHCDVGKYARPTSATGETFYDAAGGPYGVAYLQEILVKGPAYSGEDACLALSNGTRCGGRYTGGATPPERALSNTTVDSPQLICFDTIVGATWAVGVPQAAWSWWDGSRQWGDSNGQKASQDGGGGKHTGVTGATMRIGGRPPPTQVDRQGLLARLVLLRGASATRQNLERLVYTFGVQAGLA